MPPPFLPGEGGCNPITKSGALILISVVPAKAGTQGFQSLGPGSPLSRGRRVGLSAGFPDSLEGRCPWQNWVPAFPTELVPWAEGPRADKEGGIVLNHPNASNR